MKHIRNLLHRHRPAPPRTTPVEARLLCKDGTIMTVTVHIPETTPVRDQLSAVSVALFAQFEVTGEGYRIHSISQRTSHEKSAPQVLPVNAEGPIWPLR